MLLLNGELFNPNDGTEKFPAEKEHYKLATKGIKNKYGEMGHVRFVSTQMAEDLHGQPIPPSLIPMVAHDGMNEWMWTEGMANVRTRKDGVRTLWRKSMQMPQGALNVSVENQMDLLYFIIEKSPMLKKGWIRIDDIREAEEAKVRKEKDAIRLKAAIYGEASPLSSETMLRQTCHALGIAGADKDTDNRLRIKLESFIDGENKKNDVRAMGTANFLDFLQMGDELHRRGIVNKAITRKVIEYTKMHGWMWASSKNTIVRVPDTRIQDKFAYLCEWLAGEKQKEVFDDLVKALAESGYFEDEQPYEEIKWLAQRYGLPVSQTKKKDLAEKIAEHIKG
jgi:hypothetical protein